MDIEARWDEIEEAEPRLRAEVEERVVRRVSKRFDSLDPLLRYRLGGSVASSDELGYDAQDRLVLARFQTSVSYTRYGDGWAETCMFDYAFGSVQLISVERWTLGPGGRPTRLDARDSRGYPPGRGERFDYDDRGRVVTITPDAGWRLTATYDDQTSRPAALRSDSGEVLYLRPVKGMKQIVGRVEEALFEALLAWARAQQPGEPVSAFLVGWSVTFPLIPSVVLVSREQLGTWNAAELAPDAVEVPDSTDAQLVSQTWQDDDEAPPRMYARLAKRLSAEDFAHWPLAENFVVAVVNMQTDDEDALARQLRASVPPKLMTTFKRRGLLSP